MVDMRFGHGTWKGILAERAKRIQEAKEAAAKARREAQRAQDEMMENVKTTALVSMVIGAAVGLLFLAIAILPK
jgi:F0F1-type ATP synthase membrane subunit b/b'